MELDKTICIKTTEMHTGGEPLRIIESGYPKLEGTTVLEKRRYCREKLDHLRKFLIFEPRGHYDMYGALLVESELPEADFGVLFMHNEGYSTMCGHAMLALGRYAIDKGLVTKTGQPETQVNIHCPCGLVKAFAQYDGKRTGSVRFHSVPAYAFALDVEVEVGTFGRIKVDIGYGGAYYALVSAHLVGINFATSRTQHVIDIANEVSEAVRKVITLHHPESSDLAFLYGTIITDGEDVYDPDTPTTNICVFADREVDRSPCGSGVTARIAVQHARGLIKQGQRRLFKSGGTGSEMTGMVVETTRFGDFDAVIVEVSGKGHYSGYCEFTLEEDDRLKAGFLLN